MEGHTRTYKFIPYDQYSIIREGHTWTYKFVPLSLPLPVATTSGMGVGGCNRRTIMYHNIFGIFMYYMYARSTCFRLKGRKSQVEIRTGETPLPFTSSSRRLAGTADPTGIKTRPVHCFEPVVITCAHNKPLGLTHASPNDV